MKLEITLSTGKVIYPVFEMGTAILEGVAGYYNEQQRIGFVKFWRVID